MKLIVVTDGERVMGLGDLGVQGMGVAVSKTMLYTALGGVDPADILAVCLDVGTNNEQLLNDPLYIGTKRRRLRGDAYDELLDEFVEAAKRRFGERCVVQFEDFSNANGKRLLERYATQAAVFNDDIHGVAATTLAGVIASAKKTKLAVHEHTYLIAGAGETGHGIGEILAEYVARETRTTVAEARRRIWMVDSGGLVTRQRAEFEDDLALHKLPYAHDGMPECGTVLEAVRAVKPTALIGVRRHKHSLKVGALAGPEGETFEGYREDPAGGVAGVAELSISSISSITPEGKDTGEDTGGDRSGGVLDGSRPDLETVCGETKTVRPAAAVHRGRFARDGRERGEPAHLRVVAAGGHRGVPRAGRVRRHARPVRVRVGVPRGAVPGPKHGEADRAAAVDERVRLPGVRARSDSGGGEPRAVPHVPRRRRGGGEPGDGRGPGARRRVPARRRLREVAAHVAAEVASSA